MGKKTAEEKNTLSGQIEPLASLTAHLLCFIENGSLLFYNENIIFVRQCCPPLLDEQSHKKLEIRILVTVLDELHSCLYLNILISHSSQVGGDNMLQHKSCNKVMT